ncbi:hypothetical protein BYT27DRAFT_7184257 [Phlegmacium glaucopus]|nr:hypothetical protein BYT27DRAFT_7184257 [Phlegmacium glaucopus]
MAFIGRMSIYEEITVAPYSCAHQTNSTSLVSLIIPWPAVYLVAFPSLVKRKPALDLISSINTPVLLDLSVISSGLFVGLI